ncbi:MAG: response regulator, partial [Pseudomonadota bacterium]
MSESDAPVRVLLVDDDLDVLGANSRFLRAHDYEVVVAESAQTALTRLSEMQIDVIVTDLRMPHCSGLEFASQARESRPLIPIVFFSGYAQVPDVVAAMKLGAVEFLAYRDRRRREFRAWCRFRCASRKRCPERLSLTS